MYTGLQLGEDLSTRVRQGNMAGYLGAAEKDMVIRMAVTRLLEENYIALTNQGAIDEINPLIKTYAPFLPFNNKVLIKPLRIISIANPGGNNFVFTFDRDHNIDFTTYPTIGVGFNGLEGGTYNLFNGNEYAAVFASPNSLQVSEIGISGTYTDNTGECTASSNAVIGQPNYWPSDYYHLLAINSVHRKKLNYTIVGVKNISTVDITLGPNNIRTGEYLRFTSFGGITGINGYYYCKKLGDRKVRLYTDKLLTTPLTASGTWTSGGIIERKFDRGCEPLVSDQKIGTYQATEYFPLYETTENRIVCYQSERNQDTDITQIEYLMDYITIQAAIDVADGTTDLLQTYNQQFCNKIIETAAVIWYAINTAQNDVQISEVIQ
jgi:hypothetical protein